MPTLDVITNAIIRKSPPVGSVFVSRSLVDVSGTPLRGKVRVYPDVPSRSRIMTPINTYLDPSVIEAPLDSFGSYDLTLYDSSKCLPAGVFYVVGYRGFKYRFLSDAENEDNRPAPQSVSTAQISGVVVDLSNTPISGLVLSCVPIVPPQDEPSHMLDWSIMLPMPIRATTGNDGSFTFTVFTQSSYRDNPPILRITAAYGIGYDQNSPI